MICRPNTSVGISTQWYRPGNSRALISGFPVASALATVVMARSPSARRLARTRNFVAGVDDPVQRLFTSVAGYLRLQRSSVHQRLRLLDHRGRQAVDLAHDLRH